MASFGKPEMHVVVQTAPAIRVSLGEEFGENWEYCYKETTSGIKTPRL